MQNQLVKYQMKMLVKVVFITLVVPFVFRASNAKAQKSDTLVVKYLPTVKEDVYSKNNYYFSVLKLALDKTVDTFGPYALQEGTPSKSSVEALKNMLTGQGIDIVHTNTQQSRERVMIPIRIPLDKGLIGARLILVHEKDEYIFSSAKKASDLNTFSFSQGEQWPDTEVLRFNQLNVKTGKDYDATLEKLKTKQVDGFPRAVFEIWDEMEQQKGSGLVVADGVYLQYPAAMYFFVRKDAHGAIIAKRVYAGLKRAVEDGSFDALFNKTMKPILEKSKLEGRTPIKLKNPLLPVETPISDAELWYLKME